MIKDLTHTPLKIIADERGAVMHMLRADGPQFRAFGEVYLSQVNPGAVKAWKRHREMTLNLACVSGCVRLVIFDDRPSSTSSGTVQIFDIGPGHDYALITVPPGLWTGFTCLSETQALLANCASLPHDPAEADTRPPDTDEIPYQW